MFRFALLDLRTCYHLNTFYIWAETDVMTHLILRWTDKPPELRKTWPVRRGIPHEFRDKYLKTEWRSIEQNEASIQYEKTFTWPGWPPNVTYWFLFTHVFGASRGRASSPIFYLGSPDDSVYIHVYTELFS